MQLSNVIPTSFFVIGGSTCLVVQGGGSEFESGRCILDGYFWFFLTRYPHPLGYGVCKGGLGCLWSLNRAFLWKLYKTKVAGHPWFSGGGSPFWAPNLDPEGPGPHVLLEPWSLTMKLWCILPIAIWWGWSPYTLTPGAWAGGKRGPVGFWSLSSAFWQKLYKTKVAGHPQLSWDRSPVWTPNPDLEGPGPHVLLELWSFTVKGRLSDQIRSVASK